MRVCRQQRQPDRRTRNPAHPLLPAALVALGSQYPKLELHVAELDPADVPDALRTGALDIALVHEYDYVPAEPDPALDTEPLLAEVMYLAAPAYEPAGGYDPLRQCAGRSWIAASPGTLCHTMAVRLCHASGFGPRIRHHADDFATVLALVAAGQGVALVPQLALTAAPPGGVALTALAARRRTLIACRRGAGSHPAIAACADALRAAAAHYSTG